MILPSLYISHLPSFLALSTRDMFHLHFSLLLDMKVFFFYILLYLLSIIYLFFLFVVLKDETIYFERCNLLFGLIGHFGLLQDAKVTALALDSLVALHAKSKALALDCLFPPPFLI